jgi:hypothetical protein
MYCGDYQIKISTLCDSLHLHIINLKLETMMKRLPYDNSREVRMIFIDSKEEIILPSISSAMKTAKVSYEVMMNGLNPMNKRRFEYNNRLVAFRFVKETS